MSESQGITAEELAQGSGEVPATPEQKLESTMYLLILVSAPADEDVPPGAVDLLKNLAREQLKDVLPEPEHVIWQDRVNILNSYMAAAVRDFAEQNGRSMAERQSIVRTLSVVMPWFDYEHELDEAA